MDRKEILNKILNHLDEALYIMEISDIKPDDSDEVWFAINEAYSVAMGHYINDQELIVETNDAC